MSSVVVVPDCVTVPCFPRVTTGPFGLKVGFGADAVDPRWACLTMRGEEKKARREALFGLACSTMTIDLTSLPRKVLPPEIPDVQGMSYTRL